MWRSQAKAFIFRSSIHKTKTQVPLKTLARISSSSLHPSTWAPQTTQTIPFYPHPRFFSHSPEPIDSATEKETNFPAIDKDCILDKTPSSISLETESASTILGDGIGEDCVFDKNPDPFLLALDDSSMVFDVGVEREDDFGQNPDFISQESVDSSEKDDTFGEDPIHIAEEVVDGIDGGLLEEEMVTEVPEVDMEQIERDPIHIAEEVVDGIDGGLLEEEMVTEVPEVDMEQVERVLSVLQSSLEGPLESALDELVLNVSEEFVVRVIQTPQVSGENLIGFFRWASKKPEILITARVIDCLVRTVSVACRKREVYSLWDLVKEIGEKEEGLINNEILNGLILLFWKLGKGKAGLEVFNKFDEFGCEHVSDSYYFTIEALLTRSMYDSAWSVCEKMLNSGRLPGNEEVGKILVGLCKGSKARDAYLVFLMAKEHKKCPPKSSVNFLVNKLSVDNETVHLAAELLEDFSGELRKYAIKPFTSVIRGLCRKQEVNEAKKLVLKMINEGPPPGNAAFNFVISGLSKAGEMNEAISLMKVMESRGLRPDVYTYTVIMSGFANGGQMDDACKIFSEAKKVHSKLCPAIYHTLIRGFCKIEEFDKALKFLGEMKESGVKPNVDEYNKIIQSLCLKSLDWLAAEKLLGEMKESGLYLNGITRGLIRAVKELETEELQLGGVSVVV